MSTPYNPTGREDNCGFCAISYGLYLQNRSVVDADQLYLATIERLGLTREGNHDPIPRMLIFPDLKLPGGTPSTAYSALSGVLGLNSYTVTDVADHLNLRFTYSRMDVMLPNQFLAYQSESGNRGSLSDFTRTRLDFLRSKGGNPSLDAVRRQIVNAIAGHSIIGSEDASHFINAHIDPGGYLMGYDAQNDKRYDAKGLRERIGTVALFMHLR